MAKRRKTSDSGDFIKIGDKKISLAGYFAPSKPKDSKTDADVKTSEPEVLKNEQPRNEQVRSGQHHPVSGKNPHNSKKEPGNKEFLRLREKLPIWEHRNQIRDSLRTNDTLIVTAETGSGKSTQVPQFLFTEDWCRKRTVKVRLEDNRVNDVSVGGVIAVTQPRRVAAITLAQRISQEAGTPLHPQPSSRWGHVGYSVRFDRNLPKGFKIKFVTEGMLLQEMLHDPHLRQYSAVIVDEVHERGLDADLVCGFLKQIISGDKAGRGGIPLKVVLMSATANLEQLQSFFAVEKAGTLLEPEVLDIPGRLHPVKLIHTPKPVPDIEDALLQTIFKIHKEEPCPGDILAFLTGQETIENAQRHIEDYAKTLGPNVPKLIPIPLYGQLSIEQQQKAFDSIKGGLKRKVVLATNIAETSVTVPGVRYVVDTGKAKMKKFRGPLQMESLLAKPISKSSATQRAGRAGREAPGKCYRLYTEESFEELKETHDPEILRVDLVDAILTMKARGVDDIFEFPLIDSPDDEAMDRALLHLHIFGAIDDDGLLTEIGREIATLPLSASLGRVLLAAAQPEYDCILEAIDIISCLTAGEDIFHQLLSEEERESVEPYRNEVYRREGDLLTYLTTMQRYTAEETDRTEWCRLRKINAKVIRQAVRIRKQLRDLCVEKHLLSEAPEKDPQPFNPMSPERAELLLKCFLTGFCVKTAILAPDGSYVTIRGRNAVAIHPSSVLHGKKKEAIMFMEHVFTTKPYARKVSFVQSDWITDALEC